MGTHTSHTQLDRKAASICPQRFELEPAVQDPTLPGTHVVAHAHRMRMPKLGRDQHRNIPTQDLIAPPAKDVFGGGIELAHDVGGVDDDNGIQCRGNDLLGLWGVAADVG